MKAEEGLIIVETDYDVTADKIWEAITQIDQMKKWYFENIPNFEAKIGFKTQFVVQSEAKIFTHQWEVIETIPNQKIKYTWSYIEYPGDATVTFDLVENKSGTKLTLTCEVLEDFPEDISEFKRESCIEGWNYFLGQRLKDYLSV
jgi:uncharacterized protein YndB with AHSA1/START domain